MGREWDASGQCRECGAPRRGEGNAMRIATQMTQRHAVHNASGQIAGNAVNATLNASHCQTQRQVNSNNCNAKCFRLPNATPGEFK
jgi:hypothetical protein